MLLWGLTLFFLRRSITMLPFYICSSGLRAYDTDEDTFYGFVWFVSVLKTIVWNMTCPRHVVKHRSLYIYMLEDIEQKDFHHIFFSISLSRITHCAKAKRKKKYFILTMLMVIAAIHKMAIPHSLDGKLHTLQTPSTSCWLYFCKVFYTSFSLSLPLALLHSISQPHTERQKEFLCFFLCDFCLFLSNFIDFVWLCLHSMQTHLIGV